MTRYGGIPTWCPECGEEMDPGDDNWMECPNENCDFEYEPDCDAVMERFREVDTRQFYAQEANAHDQWAADHDFNPYRPDDGGRE